MTINERVSPKRLAEIIARAEVCDDSVLTDYRDIESIARELQQYRAAMLAAPAVQADRDALNSPVIPDGWTGSDKANAALVMLDRIDTLDPVDDDRIEGIKRIIREMAAAPKQEADTDNTTQQFESSGLIVTSDERKMEHSRCSKHPDTFLQVHPFEQLMSYPPRPVMYCPLCNPSVAERAEFDKQLRGRR